MNREFLELYERELKTLYERSKEFAEEFPGVATRLGALSEDRADPAIAGLLEGAAFLAARVQLKLNSEFDTFTIEMLEQLIPGLLSQIPSFALLRAMPDFSDPALAEGLHLKAGDYVDTTFVERGKPIGCRYRLVNDLSIWPYQIDAAEFLANTAPLQARGIEPAASVVSALRIGLALPSADAGSAVGSVKNICPDTLTVHIVETMSDAVKIHELLFCRLKRIIVRHEGEKEAPRFHVLPPDAIEPVGFEEGQSLFGRDNRVFSGFGRIREYFAFQAKFLGFRLRGLERVLRTIEEPRFDIYFEFEEGNKRLASVVKPTSFALYAVPVANLFEVTCTPVPMRTQDHEHVVVVERSRPLDHEISEIIEVTAQFNRSKERISVYPLYSAPPAQVPVDKAYYYSSRKLERRRTEVERRTGLISSYIGTDTFISLKEPPETEAAERVRSLNVRALVTNRHLTDQLPVKSGRADFVAVNNTDIGFECIGGPTSPRESLVGGSYRGRGSEPSGSMLWKLINILQFNHLGLAGEAGPDSGAALREMLMVFADASVPDIERRIRGITAVRSEPMVRKIRQADGFNAARGLGVSIEFDESAFEGSGVFLMGLVLSKFLTEYAAINSFVETTIVSRQRSRIATFRPQLGERTPL